MGGRIRQGSALPERENVSRMIALLLGLGYLAGGVVGFTATGLTGFVADTNESLLGFDLNVFHDIVHVAIGTGLLVASRMRDVAITQGVLIGVGLFYVLAAVLGFLNYLQILSIDSALAPDNFLHLLTGATALIFGLIGVAQQSRSPSGTRASADAPTSAQAPRPEAY